MRYFLLQFLHIQMHMNMHRDASHIPLLLISSQDVDERFQYPNLYAQGTSKHVRAFNCVQRSHQQIYETFTTAVVSGLAASITFPLCAAASTLTYAVGKSSYFISVCNSSCRISQKCAFLSETQ